MKLRHLNPFRHMRLEREVENLSAGAERLRSGVVNYIDVVGRQQPPESAAGVLRRAILAENEIGTMRLQVLAALRDMRHGRHDAAVAELEAVAGVEHLAPEPLRLVEVAVAR